VFPATKLFLATKVEEEFQKVAEELGQETICWDGTGCKE
jgi:hypothetical protein